MLLTIIVFYSFIVRCLKRENKLIGSTGKQTSFDSATNSISSYSITNSTTSSSAANSIAYNHLSKNHRKNSSVSAINRSDKKDQQLRRESLARTTEQGEDKTKQEEENLNEDSGKEPFSEDDEVADDNQFDEEEFYNIIATKAAAFGKRNSNTSTVSSGSMYDDTYRTKRHSLRSQSSTCSDIMETSVMSNTTRRSSEESCRLQNRKLNYKSRRHGFQTLSKRRRTTGRYFSVFTISTKSNFPNTIKNNVFDEIRINSIFSPLCASNI